MTVTTIKLNKELQVTEIQKGTILKKNDDMFIVAKISEAQFNSVVEESLFGTNYNNSHNARQTFLPKSQAVRNPSEAKYVLISLTTGLKFYPEFLTLQDLFMRITKAGFKIVNRIEITEIR